jgi:hypothetical protein
MQNQLVKVEKMKRLLSENEETLETAEELLIEYFTNN